LLGPTALLQVKKGTCERELQKLRACWLTAFKAAMRNKSIAESLHCLMFS
jgi:hypothetical protein